MYNSIKLTGSEKKRRKRTTKFQNKIFLIIFYALLCGEIIKLEINNNKKREYFLKLKLKLFVYIT
jgi:hypothetical protein